MLSEVIMTTNISSQAYVTLRSKIYPLDFMCNSSIIYLFELYLASRKVIYVILIPNYIFKAHVLEALSSKALVEITDPELCKYGKRIYMTKF